MENQEGFSGQTALARRSGLEIQQYDERPPLSIEQVKQRVQMVEQLMREVLREGEHYGKIEGCGDKKALLKSGADKLAMMFQLAPAYDVKIVNIEGGHREYRITCTLNGLYQGVGSACTLEKKYRYRYEYERGNRTRVENPDIADVYNTCLKIAKKRAHVDAVITATAASDIFTQDIGDPDELPQPEQTATQHTIDPMITAMVEEVTQPPLERAPTAAPRAKPERIQLLENLRNEYAADIEAGLRSLGQEVDVKTYMSGLWKCATKAAGSETTHALRMTSPQFESAISKCINELDELRERRRTEPAPSDQLFPELKEDNIPYEDGDFA